MNDPTKLGAPDMAARMAAIWRRILDHGDFGTSDSFFDVGGHSLVATELAIEIEREFGFRVPAETVFDHPTIDDLCAFVATKA